ncbi:sensor histidine kinase [Paludisphaera mucosa]|uniref:histidine kinase n=1 Tax=Paludisphaera mucosa TaxID=3030827 RepID=A0ABT6FKJ8_9BACT|nr:PAS domain-containing sensor histidine kinase [Paludisphaera mucosa]MDG3008091.1 ATP-binding protein [Paludisphaera mucosa]
MKTEIQTDADPAYALAEALPHIVFEALADGRPAYCSRRWNEYTGLPADADLAEGWADRVHPDDRERLGRAWRDALAAGAPVEAECRLRAGDGRHRWFLVRALPRRDADGAVASWVGSCTDVDDLKAAQAGAVDRLVRERTAELRRSNDDLERFAATASHDLQEPLRKVQAFGDRLADRCGPMLDDRGREDLRRIVRAAGRMRGLIVDLLDLARVGLEARSFAAVDLAAVAAEVVSDLEVAIRESGGRVEVGPLPTIQADPVQMRQLFQNLIGNALKFHRPGEPPSVRVAARQVAAAWELEVADQGVGFDAEHHERIFEPFQRLHGRNAYEGAGMGLAICRRIVDRHAGTIAATSAPGAGTTFRVALPAHVSESGTARP